VTEIVIVDIELNGLSVLGLHVLKAALTHAAAHRDVKEHDLSLDEFCALAGVGKLSGDGMRRLLTEGQRVLGCIEFVDTGARGKKDMPWGSSPMFGFVSADDERVSFEVFNFVLHDYVLCRVLALTPTQRQ
jgi:hypothetical protein